VFELLYIIGNLGKEKPNRAFGRLGDMRRDFASKKGDRDGGLGPRRQNILPGAYVLATRWSVWDESKP
jgi:hypothetical protein